MTANVLHWYKKVCVRGQGSLTRVLLKEKLFTMMKIIGDT